MEKEEKYMDYIFNEFPLYSKEVFNVFYEKDNQLHYNIEEYKRFWKFISTINNKIITKCIYCNKELLFHSYI